MDKIVKDTLSAYYKLMQPQSITKIKIAPDLENDSILHWQLKTLQRNLQRKKKISYSTFGSVNSKNFEVQKFPYSSETSEFASAYTSCGQMKVSIVEVKENHVFKQYIEIWRQNVKLMSFDLTVEGIHGNVINTSYFGSIKWSHDGTKILYIAENKPTNFSSLKKSFLDAELLNENNQQSIKEIKNKFIFNENWGEQIEHCKEPTLCLLDLKKRKIINLYEMMPENISISRVFWSKDDQYVVFSGYLSSPWRHGLLFSQDKQSGIYAYKFSSKTLKTIVPCKESVNCLTVSPDGSNLIFLTNPALCPYSPRLLKCVKLSNSTSFSFGLPKVLNTSIKYLSQRSNFPGFFILDFVTECWLDNQTIIFECRNRSHVNLYCLNINTGDLILLAKEGNWKLLGIKNKIIFAVHSLPIVPDTFKMGQIRYSDRKLCIEWKTVYQFPEILNDLTWKIKEHIPISHSEKLPVKSYESIVIRPNENKIIKGLVVYPHGGPQAIWDTQFCLKCACLARLGFVVLKVNYRGSVGFSINSIESITGNVGTQDVKDVHQAALEVIEELKIRNNNVFVMGGSWGGSIALHLVAKYPNFYRAVLVRNPVCNIAFNAASSDTPEWAYKVCGISYTNNIQPNVQDYTEMLLKSPSFIADRIKTPVMFLIGESDKRCPALQSFELLRILKANNVKVKMNVYPKGNHSLNKLEFETDMFLNTVLWFSEHIL